MLRSRLRDDSFTNGVASCLRSLFCFHAPPAPNPPTELNRALLLLCLALALLLPGTMLMPLMDRDEPRFARAAIEMARGDQWTVPYFNGDYRFDKPPLTYWWMRLHYALFGENEFAARLHSVLAAWLAAVVVARLGAFLFSARAGLLAAAAFLACAQILTHGRLAVADMPMVLAVAAAMDASARLVFAPVAPRRFGPHFWYLSAALGVGFLAKGPIAWAVPVAAWLLYRWPVGRRPVPWRRLQPLAAFGVASGIVALWGWEAMRETDWAFFRVGIGEHVVERGRYAFDGRVTIPGVYYLVTAFASLLPWSPFAFGALFRSGPYRESPQRALLLSWFLAPFAIFSFYATQLPHYVMPGFAGFLLLMMRDGKLPEIRSPGERRWFLGATAPFALLAAGLALALALRPLPDRFAGLAPVLWAGVGIVAVVAVAAPCILRFAPQRIALLAALALIALGVGTLNTVLTGQIRKIHPALALRERLGEGAVKELRFGSVEFQEPSLVFYLDSDEPWRFEAAPEGLAAWVAASPDDRVGVFRLRSWRLSQILVAQAEPKPYIDRSEEVLAILDDSYFGTRADPGRFLVLEGLNVARSTWEEILVILPRDAGS